MKSSKDKKPKDKEPDFTNVTADDIAKKFLESPPKPKISKRKQNKVKDD